MNSQDIYENNQNFNFITKLLHQTRYINLQKLIIRASKEKKGKLKIIDIGCGSANAYKAITKLDIDFEYFGVDLNENFFNTASQRYNEFENFKIVYDSIENQFEKFTDADVIIGLECFEHMHESLLIPTFESISKASFMYLYITVPNEIGPAILIKNIGSVLMGYSRHKEYKWRETFFASIYMLNKVGRNDSGHQADGHSYGHRGFDWRSLSQKLSQNVNIIKMTSSPFTWIPKFISPTIGFICVNKD